MASIFSAPPVKDRFRKNKISKRERRKRLDTVLKINYDKKLPDAIGYPFGSYYYYPKGVSFINKDPEEEIILLVRRHFITNTGWILVSILLAILPAAVAFLPSFELIPIGIQILSLAIWYLLIIAFVFEEFLSWFFNVNIITDERIIDIDFLNLIYREITDANIDNIEDVTTQIGGAVRTYFDYGDVQIQTSAEIPQITFESVSRPDLIAKVLHELRLEEELEKIEGRVR